MTQLITQLARLNTARLNCKQSGNMEWLDKHTEALRTLVKAHMPSGSGFDVGTRLDYTASAAEKLVFHTSFHHMDENGTYAGWTEHVVTVRPSLSFGFTVKVSGRDRNDIKSYIAEAFQAALSSEVE